MSTEELLSSLKLKREDESVLCNESQSKKEALNQLNAFTVH